MTRKNVNILHEISKEEVLNSKNLNIITRSGVGRDIINIPSQDRLRGKDSLFPDPDK
jgi:hypothetical protein